MAEQNESSAAAGEQTADPIRPDGPTFDPPGPKASQALAVARAGTMATAFAGLIPTSIGEAFTWAGYLAKSTAVPMSVRKGGPETVLTVILAGMELGLTPIRAIQSITNISGTLCMKADLQLALVKNRGVMVFMDEGFERYGQTDSNLGKRLALAMRKVADTEDVELVVEKIAAATSTGMKDGDPYGWAVGIRQGDRTIHVRTFTYADAVKAVIYEKDENGEGKASPKALADKFNYKSFPGDMYPKRARTRLLQVVASDVTNGLPAVEAIEGGQIIEGEFTVHHGDDGPGQADADDLLQAIRDEDQALAAGIESGFEQLKLGKAARLQRLTQFKGKPKDLMDWLKGEYAGRQGKKRTTPDVLSGGGEPAKTEPAKPAAEQQQHQPAKTEPAQGQPGAIIDAVADDEDRESGQLTDANATVMVPNATVVVGQEAVVGTKPMKSAGDAVRSAVKQSMDSRAQAGDGESAAREASAKPMTPAKDLAARFRKNMKTF